MGFQQLSPCRGLFFAPGGHFQTIFAHFWPSERLSEPGEKWSLPLKDGDCLTARIHGNPAGPAVLAVFHGLGGDIDSKDVHLAAGVGVARGWTVVRVNMRGAGEGYLESRGIYHSGRSADVSEVIQSVRKRFPDRPVVVAGVSLSGNVILNLLAGFDGEDLPDAAVVFNPAIQLANASTRLSQFPGLIYDKAFVKDMRALFHRMQDKQGLLKEIQLPEKLSVAIFDDLITAPAAGFKDRFEYYRTCSSWQRVDKIQTPTVVVMTEDDPIVPCDDFKTARWSSAVHLHLEKTGGHVGYLQTGKSGRIERWLPLALAAALDELKLPRPH